MTSGNRAQPEPGAAAPLPDDAAFEPLGAALARVLHAAVTRPDALDASAVEPIARAFSAPPSSEELGSGIAALAALLYSRSEAVDHALGERLLDLLATPMLPDVLAIRAVRALVYWSSTSFAGRGWPHVQRLLRADPSDLTLDRLLPVMRALVEWHPDIVGLDGVLSVADRFTAPGHRAFLFDLCLERFIFLTPQRFSLADLDRLAAAFSDVPRFRFGLYALAQRPGTTEEVRHAIARRLPDLFPTHAPAARILCGRPVRLLVVLNSSMGLGDDVVRVVPLLQGLLDANPELTVTLVTWRTFLYDHPRVTTILIADAAGLDTALADRPDGLLEFFQPDAPDFTFRLQAHTAIDRSLADRRPSLLVTGDMGRAASGRQGGRPNFLYQTLELDGRDVAHERGLDEKVHESVYDPAFRLLAELGLPQRAAEERPRSPSVLTGEPSGDAERIWRAMLDETADPSRPVALVGPYGGSSPTKGFFNQYALLAAQIAGLVAEGYRVVLLPNGQPWGSLPIVDATLALLDAATRAHVCAGPDPAEPDEGRRVELHEREGLNYADRVIRLFKYFASYADLVVTVEGWLAHLAYNLGRPFRLLAVSSSFSSEWFPWGRGPGQLLVGAFSEKGRPPEPRPDLLGKESPPPFPHRPRQGLLDVILPELGRIDRRLAEAPLQKAASSPDPYVRQWAIAALGCLTPVSENKVRLLAALDDTWSGVVMAAAEALLRGDVDCGRELGLRYRDVLKAHVDIARQNWTEVEALGPAALPALFQATRTDVHDVKAGARDLLRRMLLPFVPEGRSLPK